uniref:Disease resistance N-terminal domain-containing protein n=1 Tax=Oryza glaberrima TaxID=4538 RepID=I1PER7_ORYGL
MAAAREAFAAKLANVLVGMAKEEVETLLGVPGAIAKLETTLADLSSILADADRRRIDDPGVERWVRELKDAMYDADDILDRTTYAASSCLSAWASSLIWIDHAPSIVSIGHDLLFLSSSSADDQKVTTGTRITRKLQLHGLSRENFPSLVELTSADNPKLQRISNSPRLRHIVVIRCPGLKVVKDLQSLRSVIWKDLDADALPEYLRETELNKLDVYCSLRLLKLISLQDGSYEWEKIQHVQLLKAYGKRSTEDKVDRHIFYTKDPYSFEADMGEDL